MFGLRRALQVAGAETVLMSLWSVPDRETQELMTLFYSKWLSGQDKHEAFEKRSLNYAPSSKSATSKTCRSTGVRSYWSGARLGR